MDGAKRNPGFIASSAREAGNDTMDGQGGNDDNCNGGSEIDSAVRCEHKVSVP